jgi:hypothetical protein
MNKQIAPVEYHLLSYNNKTFLLIFLFLVTLMLAVFTAKSAEKQVVKRSDDKELAD